MAIEGALRAPLERVHPDQADAGSRRDAHGLDWRVVSGAEWDALSGDFDGICQEQLAVFAEARWPGVTVEPVVFSQGARLAGGCVVMYRRLPFGLGGIAIAKWGPALRVLDHPQRDEDYAGMIETLIARYCGEMGMMLTVLPRALPDENNFQLAHLAGRGFTAGPGLPFPNRYFVRIEADEEAQRASFAQKWRYHLNKSGKEALEFSHRPASDLPVFQALYGAMLDRKRFPDYSAVHTLEMLMATETDAIRPELFLVHHEGEPVAGAVIFTAGETAVYLYGATSNRALPLKAGYFLHGRIIEWLRQNTRARWYDLGGTDGFEGLHQFKSGMVGKTGVISTVPPAMHYAEKPLPMLAGRAIYKLRDLKSSATRLFHRFRP